MNLGELRTATIAHLGTTATDRAYTPARLNRWINDACNALYAELPPSYRTQTGTWAADSAAVRSYTLGTQAVPVTALSKVLQLRLTDGEGSPLRLVDFDQLELWDGLAYALVGADESVVLWVNGAVDAGAALWAAYETWPAELSGDGQSPSTIPLRFHDVITLRVAKMGFASGGEGRFPRDLADLLTDREAQFWAHVGRRSADTSKQRLVGASLL